MQRRIWDLQPAGVNDWVVAPMNVHDEVAVVSIPEAVESVAQVVKETVESFRRYVPLIGIGWKKSVANWSDK